MQNFQLKVLTFNWKFCIYENNGVFFFSSMCIRVRSINAVLFKGLVPPRMKIMSLINHPHIVPKP